MQKRSLVYLVKLTIFIVLPLFAFQNRISTKAKTSGDLTKTIETYLEEAQKLSDQHKYTQAITLLTEVQKEYETHQLWKEYIICGIRKSILADNTSDEDKRNYAYTTLDVSKKHLTSNDSLIGKSYQQVAESNTLFEKYDSSLFFLKKAIPILNANKNWEALAWAQIITGVNHFYLDNNDDFKTAMSKTEDIYKKHQLDKKVYISILELRGAVYSLEGNYELALQNMYQTVQFYQNLSKKLKHDSLTIANNYTNISMTYISKGAYNEAIDYQNKALKIYEEINNQTDYAFGVTSLALAYWSKQDFRKTINLSQRAIELSKSLSEKDEKNILNETYIVLSKAYKAIEKNDSSRYYLNLAKNLPDESIKNIAWIEDGLSLNKQNQPNKALLAFQKSNDYKSSSIEDKSTYYMGLAYTYTKLNDFDHALKSIQQGLAIHNANFTDTSDFYKNPSLTDINQPVFFLQNLEAKAYCLSQFNENHKNLEAALATYELTLNWLDTMRQSYAYEDAKVVINTRNRSKYERAVSVAYELYENTNDPKYIEKAFSFAEKMKSNVLMANTQANDNQSIIPEQLKQREKSLALDVAFYDRELHKAKKEDEPKKIELYQTYLTDNRIALTELKDTLKKDYPKYYNLQYSPILATVKEIQTELKKDNSQALISYFSGDSATYAFTITENNSQFVRLEKTPNINKNVTTFRQELSQSDITSTVNTFTNYNQKAYQLFQTILEPTLSSLPNSVDQLTIIPDGSLNYVPFEILTNTIAQTPSQDFSKMPYLLYKYQIKYGYSSTLLRENKNRYQELSANSNCLAYAPTYQNNEPIAQRGTMRALRGSTANLKGTALEIQAVAEYFAGEFNQSETATKENFIKKAPNFGILHLAMHGEANFENEKMANLKFANNNLIQNDDNLMYHSDIVNLDLNAQLVVLSACETGLGKYIYGEGIASLGRSFMYAGVPSVIMSLWKVDDQSTSQLMPYFYKYLAKGMQKGKALHEAKIEYLKTADFANLHPHYWAGFIAIGDTQPIKKQSNRSFWLIGSLLFVSLLGFFGYWHRKS